MPPALNKNSSQSNDKDSTLDPYKGELSKEPLRYHKLDSVEVYRLSWNTLLPMPLMIRMVD
ncbi:MAG: hypothetical protein AB2989_00945 [Candidatus Symbiodolus clandestinus]